VTAPKVYTADDPEPDYSGGAVFAVHYGNYRRQEIWVASGDNIGNLYPLGGEAGKPRIVEDPRSELEKIGPTLGRSRTWQQPPGTIPLHPTWHDMVARGPVVMLVPGQADTYAAGWATGRQRLLAQIEQLRDDEDVPPGHGWRAARNEPE
jgi:hypothetical protein